MREGGSYEPISIKLILYGEEQCLLFSVLPWKLKMFCLVQFTLYSVANMSFVESALKFIIMIITVVVIVIIMIIAKLFFV
jgi:hypothetical protein